MLECLKCKKMVCFSAQPRGQIFVKGYDVLLVLKILVKILVKI